MLKSKHSTRTEHGGLLLGYELNGAVEVSCCGPVFVRKQEIHDLPHFRQLRDPFPELLHVGLQTLQRRILRVLRVSPERPDRLQELAGHQVGEVRGPVLGDAGDGDSSVAREGEVPAGEVELLEGEVEAMHGLVGEQQPLAVLTLLPGFLQR